MRILYYNWADPDDPQGRGGGVSVYQRNLRDGLQARTGIEAAFLSSGTAHDLRPGPPHVEVLANGHYRLVNSGLLAPSHADFAGAAQLDHGATEVAFADFIAATGPWDVIHFNTLEGLPAGVLALRALWPDTQIVLSLHNYYPLCPQVNLWHLETEHCEDFQGGVRCVTCLPVQASPPAVRMIYGVDTALTRLGLGPGKALHDRVFRPALGLGWRMLRRMRHRPVPVARPPADQGFGVRRARMVALINAHVDAVLCVSGRVAQIARHHGLRADRLQVMPIGTRAADDWVRTRPKARLNTAPLHLAYLGYMRRDKGFGFLIEALAALPEATLKRLHLTVAARRGAADMMAAMAALRPRLAGLTHLDGYAPGDLDALLAGVDLGLIPVLWEDNLPQVAIEMHARHIPLLTSDRGGARELGNSPDWVFRAGDAHDFARVLGLVLEGRLNPDTYWRNAAAPVTMTQHVEALIALYSGAA